MKKSKYFKILTKSFLKKEYLKNKKSTTEIAKEINCSKGTALYRLKKSNIRRRNRYECRKGKFMGKNSPRWNKHHTKEARRKISQGNKNKIVSKMTRIKMGIASKKRWRNKLYREKTLLKIFRAQKLKPNKPEKALKKLLNRLLPNEYKYVGNGKIVIDRFNPDFINVNGQKKIIELYGDYWHNLSSYKKRDRRRVRIYKKYGYKTLIIWQHELKDLNRTKNRILNFHKTKLIKC